jgi:hypothetical protein
MSSKDAVIVELNLLIDFARSAASSEAGTAFTKNTIDVVRKETQNFLLRHPEVKPLIDKALEQASLHKKDIDELLKNKQTPKDDNALDRLRRGVAALSVISPEVNQTLNALLLNVEEYVVGGETHLARARQNVEKWFDDSMDRVSGVFKRYSQTMALAIGFLVALILNVDSINLTLYLWRDPSVREILAAQASNFQLPQQQFEANPQQAMQDIRDQFAGLNLPIGWGIRDSTDSPNAMINCQMFPQQESDQVFGIPLFGTTKCLMPPQSDDQTNLVQKLLGILITALAARQGAPFWFDLLKRLVNLRGTGANPTEKEAK